MTSLGGGLILPSTTGGTPLHNHWTAHLAIMVHLSGDVYRCVYLAETRVFLRFYQQAGFGGSLCGCYSTVKCA